ncbi:MAG TPA: plastocyanin/azurin family copper-binding protein [Sphingomicrobium sp.]|nr:plastocyanin/azurin family copper-binding protein [Sphingomicrobium sp.]
MLRQLRRLSALSSLLALFVSSASAQATHVVRIIANPAKDDFRFEPASVNAQPKDVIVFRAVSGAPHSIVFEGAGLSPGVRGEINSALEGRSADLSSPVLTASGREYRMVVPQIPPGSYAFFCLPHRAYDMRGELIIK